MTKVKAFLEKFESHGIGKKDEIIRRHNISLRIDIPKMKLSEDTIFLKPGSQHQRRLENGQSKSIFREL